MSRALIKQLNTLNKKEAFDFLRQGDNLKKIMSTKGTEIKFFDSPAGLTSFYKPYTLEEGTGKKLFTGERKAITPKEVAPADAENLNVVICGNTSMYCDSHSDVLLKNAGKKSMRERKGMIPHLPDHDWSMTAELGEVLDVRYEDRELRELGWNADGMAQAIVMETNLIKKWNEKAFEKYRLGRVKQHSIGLRYVNLHLAVNEPDDEYWKDEYKVWKKYIDDIINKEYVESRGYFFAVSEFILLEISGVLFGSNFLTPTLEAGEKEFTGDQPSEHIDTDDQPNKETAEPVDISAVISGMKLFN